MMWSFLRFLLCFYRFLAIVIFSRNLSPVIFRSSHLELFCKKGVLKNFAKFTGKHPCQNLFLNKVAGLRPVTLLK